jgi:hypothetical protein
MKHLKNILLLLAVTFLITGCTTSKAYTYTVETGDSIKVELDTSDDHDIDSKVPFTITKGDKTVSQGRFLTIDGYNQYVDAAKSDANITIIDEGTKNGIDYLFYSYSDSETEYNYIIKIHDSKTGVSLENTISQESAKECFNHLTFTKE